MHVGLDMIGPEVLPGLRFPAPGGPGPAEVAGALAMLLGTGRVAAVGIGCTWYPGNGAAAIAAPHLAAALGRLAGHRRR
jgi:arginase